jgi:bacillithiol biosynthesis cysteine-adding enzyme BshC
VTAVRVLTEPLGGSPLVAAALGEAISEEWFARAPRSAESWRKRLAEIRKDPATTRWAETLGPALRASGAARARLDRVADGAGVVITTGQQPGLFGGPLYGLSKAISALALADALERATGIPVAPVFWAATDDADVAEASSASVAMPGGAQVVAITTSAAPGTPLSDIPFGDLADALAALTSAAGSGSHPEFLDAVTESYVSGATMGDAYVKLMRRLLEPRGIAVLDASHAAVREGADAMLRSALQRATEVDVALRKRTADLQAAGFSAQVPLVPGLSTVFAIENGTKRRLPIKEAKRAAESAQRGMLSPNVLLRPVVERAILPTAAYVAGPGELAYFAQLSALAEVLGASKPVAVPRWSGTILEPHIERILQRYHLEIGDLRDPHAAETRFAREALPAEVTRTLAALRQDVSKRLASLRESGDAPPLLPNAVLEGAERTLQHRVDRLERRFLAAQKRTSASALQDIATARASLFPLGKRQERALNPIPILARHGEPVIDAMLNAAREHAEGLLSGRLERESPSEQAVGR